MSSDFLQQFYSLQTPVPNQLYPVYPEVKSDLKLILEIATGSRLKQGQDKKNESKQIFYCRSLGKECFKVQVDFSHKGFYRIVDNFYVLKHCNRCESTGQPAIVIKIYNLMMLKRNLIEQFMLDHELENASPELILQEVSKKSIPVLKDGPSGQILNSYHAHDYFYSGFVEDQENRRKLKKRFDNIINISIKKKRAEQMDVKSVKEVSQSLMGKEKGRKNKKKNIKKEYNKNHAGKCKVKIASNAEIFYEDQDEQWERSREKLQKNKSAKEEICPSVKRKVKTKFIRSTVSVPRNEKQEDLGKRRKTEQVIQNLFEEKENVLKENHRGYFCEQIRFDANSLLNSEECIEEHLWPKSPSIDNAMSEGDPNQIDDLFQSFYNNNSFAYSLEKKSLKEIQNEQDDLPDDFLQ